MVPGVPYEGEGAEISLLLDRTPVLIVLFSPKSST